LQIFGLDPASEAASRAIPLIAEHGRWEHAGQRYFDGEVEPCINGRTIEAGAYFGVYVSAIVERIAGERLADGGWNCEVENGSVRSSFHTTINVLDGLLEFEHATGRSTTVREARHSGEEYLLERGLFRRKSTGEVADVAYLDFAFPYYWHHDVLRALDYFSGQLERDRLAAEHYSVGIRTIQGDMRDLSALDDSSFDLVWHPYSLTFVPDSRIVFREVARVVGKGGYYYLMCANPFFAGLTHDSWNGEGYTLKQPYTDEATTCYPDQDWVYGRESAAGRIHEPREYTQTLSRIVNSLIGEGFMLKLLSEVRGDYPGAEPGSWSHFTGVAPPWLEFVWQYGP
jgi:SAM-dependent methyltransferase